MELQQLLRQIAFGIAGGICGATIVNLAWWLAKKLAEREAQKDE